MVFIMMVIAYCRSINLKKQANLLLKNIERVKQFLIEQNWTKAEMNAQWVNYGDTHIFGKSTNHTNGVTIMRYN
jgi:hypothetical protein